MDEAKNEIDFNLGVCERLFLVFATNQFRKEKQLLWATIYLSRLHEYSVSFLHEDQDSIENRTQPGVQ